MVTDQQIFLSYVVPLSCWGQGEWKSDWAGVSGRWPRSAHNTMLKTETHFPLVQCLCPAWSLNSGSWWRNYILCGLTCVLYNILYFNNNLYKLLFQLSSVIHGGTFGSITSLYFHLKKQKNILYQQLPKRITSAHINIVLCERTTLKHIFLWLF